jgi:superfamily I DNA and/or RNA helicase
MKFMFYQVGGAFVDGEYKARFKFSQIGFVSPYSAQTSRIKQTLKDHFPDPDVKTIDSWQGGEKEVMVFSAVRCN